MRVPTLCLVAVMAMGSRAPAQIAPAASVPGVKRAEVLVLGVYHMANPGRDVFNMQVDDVRSPRRQEEIAELIAVLRKFNPTRIAVEHDSQERLNERFRQYLASNYALTANEIDQLGLRLAKELGDTAVHAVDADGDFPLPRLIKYAKATGQSASLDSLMAQIGARVRAQNEYLKTHTVLQTLRSMNADENVAQDVGAYYLLARYGEPWDYPGPDLLAEWYRRNIRIYNNVMKLVTTPEDRVLVIYGAGHLGWLRQAFAANPMLRLRTLEEFVTTAPRDAGR